MLCQDENALNVPRTRFHKSRQSSKQYRKTTPKKTSHLLRSAASTPTLRSPSAKRLLRPRGSRLDLLDNTNLTSFPSLLRKASNHSEILKIIDDYIPTRPVLDEHELLPLVPDEGGDVQPTWSQRIMRKLRWRWRLQGLVH